MDCKDHTAQPRSYIQWHEWALRMTKTHKQIKCPECGLFKIWVRKTPKPKEPEPVIWFNEANDLPETESKQNDRHD